MGVIRVSNSIKRRFMNKRSPALVSYLPIAVCCSHVDTSPEARDFPRASGYFNEKTIDFFQLAYISFVKQQIRHMQ